MTTITPPMHRCVVQNPAYRQTSSSEIAPFWGDFVLYKHESPLDSRTVHRSACCGGGQVDEMRFHSARRLSRRSSRLNAAHSAAQASMYSKAWPVGKKIWSTPGLGDVPSGRRLASSLGLISFSLICTSLSDCSISKLAPFWGDFVLG